MNLGFRWTEKSAKRNTLTSRYEPVQPFFLYEFSKSFGTKYFYDIGANVGFYAMLMSTESDIVSIYAFEASPETFAHLKDNVALNFLSDRIECHDTAVSSSSGDLEFQVESALSGINNVVSTSIHASHHYGETVKVKACKLDQLHSYSGQRLCLKIDVEGHEIEVVNGAKSLLTNNLCLLQIELFRENEVYMIANMANLGYREIFRAGSDIYFTNDSRFFNADACKRVLQDSAQRIIDTHLKRWPVIESSSPIEVSAKIEGSQLKAKICTTGNLFEGKSDYAFYLYVDGVKTDTVWYSDKDTATWNTDTFPASAAIRIKGFARDKKNKNRKLIGHYDLGTVDI
ncbi:FkbM family methyltransferase [Labrenzia sp. MBR-25]|jgi:FkbM family methyltransferase